MVSKAETASDRWIDFHENQFTFFTGDFNGILTEFEFMENLWAAVKDLLSMACDI